MSEDWPRAFEQADAWRRAANEIVAQVRAGAWSVADAHAAADADPAMGRVFAMKVYEVVPGIGKVKSRRAMASIGLDDDIFLADVPAAKRAEIIERFAELEGVAISDL